MKRYLLLSISLLCVGFLYGQTGKIRVATVGNSLTGATNDYGFYGMALGELLGDEYEVTKFGKGASGIFIKLREDNTTEENPDEYKFAYINSDECAAALAYNPHIVVIKFGANDSNKKSFDEYGTETFKEDYKKLINKFRSLSTNPDIYICLPPPMFYGEGGFLGSFDDDVAKAYIQPAVKEIAQELNLTWVDLYTPLKDHPEYMPGGMDWVHPDHRGHYIMACEVYKAITGNPVKNPGGVTEDETKQYYIVNKATGLVLDCDTATKVIYAAKQDLAKPSQKFKIEHFTSQLLRIRNVETGLHVQNRLETVIVGKPGDNWRVDDPKYSLFIKPTEDGCYTIELSPEARIGISPSDKTKVVGDKSSRQQALPDLDKWMIVSSDSVPQ